MKIRNIAKETDIRPMERIKEYLLLITLYEEPIEFTPRKLKEATQLSWNQLYKGLVKLQRAFPGQDFEAIGQAEKRKAGFV